MVASILIDDADLSDIDYSEFFNNVWNHETNQSSFFNRTVTTLSTQNQNTSTEPLNFFVYFYGTNFNVYGPDKKGITMNYSLDDSTTLQQAIINSDGGTGKNGVNVWNLQGLDSQAFHSIKLIPTGGPFAIDYITYTPTESTVLTNQNLIVDDADTLISYSSGWNKTTGDFSVGIPYLGTMTGTNKQGSNMTFNFVGTSVTVYGLLNQQPGKLTVLFSVDGGTTKPYTAFNGSQTANASSWTLNQQFYHQDVQSGSHTLAVQVQEVTGGQMLWIDSVVYQGALATTISDTKSSSGGLSSGSIGGIVVGALIFFFLVGCCTKKKEYVTRVAHVVTTHTTTVVY